MKKNYIYLLILLFSTIAFSCEDDVVDQEAVNKVPQDIAFDTKNRCELSVVGVYRMAQSGYYNATDQRRGYPFGAASILQSEMRGEDMVNNQAFFDFTYEATFSTVTANNTAMWENSYACINQANLVIEGLEGAIEEEVLTEDEGNYMIGECKFIRALTYHNLLIHYARPYKHTADASHMGLPLHIKGIKNTDDVEEAKKIGRSSVEDCYTRILDDLTFAENHLTYKNGVYPITRAYSAAAVALKMRVYAHMWAYDKVIEEGSKLVVEDGGSFKSPLGNYILESDPATPFISYASNNESIFSVENSETENASVNGSLSQMISTRPGARALVSLSPILYNASFVKADDKRRTSLMMQSDDDGAWYLDKYRSASQMSDYAPIIRYAEVLLTLAEAEARENGLNDKSVKLLNAVRSRSTDAYPGFADKKGLIQAILNERRIEFMGEGRRWEDIHRLALDEDFTTAGIPAKVSYSQMMVAMSEDETVYEAESGTVNPALIRPSAIAYADRRFVWPIPNSVITRNALLREQQNEGWK